MTIQNDKLHGCSVNRRRPTSVPERVSCTKMHCAETNAMLCPNISNANDHPMVTYHFNVLESLSSNCHQRTHINLSPTDDE